MFGQRFEDVRLKGDIFGGVDEGVAELVGEGAHQSPHAGAGINAEEGVAEMLGVKTH